MKTKGHPIKACFAPMRLQANIQTLYKYLFAIASFKKTLCFCIIYPSCIYMEKILYFFSINCYERKKKTKQKKQNCVTSCLLYWILSWCTFRKMRWVGFDVDLAHVHKCHYGVYGGAHRLKLKTNAIAGRRSLFGETYFVLCSAFLSLLRELSVQQFFNKMLCYSELLDVRRVFWGC